MFPSFLSSALHGIPVLQGNLPWPGTSLSAKTFTGHCVSSPFMPGQVLPSLHTHFAGSQFPVLSIQRCSHCCHPSLPCLDFYPDVLELQTLPICESSVKHSYGFPGAEQTRASLCCALRGSAVSPPLCHLLCVTFVGDGVPAHARGLH